MRRNQGNNRLSLKAKKKEHYHVPDTQAASPIFKGKNWINQSDLPPSPSQEGGKMDIPEGRKVKMKINPEISKEITNKSTSKKLPKMCL